MPNDSDDLGFSADPEEIPSNELQTWIRQGRHKVPPSTASTRLDRYLSDRFTYRTRTQWVEIIKSGRVRVNGKTCRPSLLIRPGVTVEYEPEGVVEPEVNRDIAILYEDEDLLAVNKPGNLPVHPSGRYFRNTLLAILLEARGQTLDRPGVRIVHRLDRETSGVLIFGKNRDSTNALASQFKNREAEKTYVAIVHGRPTEEEFVHEGALGPRRNSQIRKAVGVVPPEEGKSARTRFRVLARSSDHSLVEATPETGRLHQIRVHIQDLGYPIVGDKMYGLSESFFLKLAEGDELSEQDQARLRLDRQALHAWKLRITHPTRGTRLALEAPLPSELVELCAEVGLQTV